MRGVAQTVRQGLRTLKTYPQGSTMRPVTAAQCAPAPTADSGAWTQADRFLASCGDGAKNP